MRPLTPFPTSSGPSPRDGDEFETDPNAPYTVDVVPDRPLTWRDRLKNWPELLKTYWWAVVLFFGLSSVAALVVYMQMLATQAALEREPVAGATENMDIVIPEADTRAVAPQAPSEVLEHKMSKYRRDDRIVGPNDLAREFGIDTFGRAALRREAARKAAKRQAALRLPLVPDTTATTVRDREMGAYRPTRMVASRTSGSRASDSWDQSRAMYDNYPPTDQPPVQTDPFGTIKPEAYGGSYSGTSNAQLMPDVFYKCVVNGAQTVRSGSVALLRLTEDAVISGVTFPKNLVFAAIISVETNRVTFAVSRLGPTRVQASVYDYNYLPGVMIDPDKKSPAVRSEMTNARSATGQEAGAVVNQATAGVSSVGGAAGRVGTGIVSRVLSGNGSSGPRRLREVLLPDGYPILITSTGAGQYVSRGM